MKKVQTSHFSVIVFISVIFTGILGADAATQASKFLSGSTFTSPAYNFKVTEDVDTLRKRLLYLADLDRVKLYDRTVSVVSKLDIALAKNPASAQAIAIRAMSYVSMDEPASIMIPRLDFLLNQIESEFSLVPSQASALSQAADQFSAMLVPPPLATTVAERYIAFLNAFKNSLLVGQKNGKVFLPDQSSIIVIESIINSILSIPEWNVTPRVKKSSTKTPSEILNNYISTGSSGASIVEDLRYSSIHALAAQISFLAIHGATDIDFLETGFSPASEDLSTFSGIILGHKLKMDDMSSFYSVCPLSWGSEFPDICQPPIIPSSRIEGCFDSTSPVTRGNSPSLAPCLRYSSYPATQVFSGDIVADYLALNAMAVDLYPISSGQSANNFYALMRSDRENIVFMRDKNQESLAFIKDLLSVEIEHFRIMVAKAQRVAGLEDARIEKIELDLRGASVSPDNLAPYNPGLPYFSSFYSKIDKEASFNRLMSPYPAYFQNIAGGHISKVSAQENLTTANSFLSQAEKISGLSDKQAIGASVALIGSVYAFSPGIIGSPLHESLVGSSLDSVPLSPVSIDPSASAAEIVLKAQDITVDAMLAIPSLSLFLPCIPAPPDSPPIIICFTPRTQQVSYLMDQIKGDKVRARSLVNKIRSARDSIRGAYVESSNAIIETYKGRPGAGGDGVVSMMLQQEDAKIKDIEDSDVLFLTQSRVLSRAKKRDLANSEHASGIENFLHARMDGSLYDESSMVRKEERAVKEIKDAENVLASQGEVSSALELTPVNVFLSPAYRTQEEEDTANSFMQEILSGAEVLSSKKIGSMKPSDDVNALKDYERKLNLASFYSLIELSLQRIYAERVRVPGLAYDMAILEDLDKKDGSEDDGSRSSFEILNLRSSMYGYGFWDGFMSEVLDENSSAYNQRMMEIQRLRSDLLLRINKVYALNSALKSAYLSLVIKDDKR